MIVYQNHHHHRHYTSSQNHHDHESVTTATTETKEAASSSSLGSCASALLVQDWIIAPSLMEQDQALQDAAHNTTTSNNTHHKNQEIASSVRDLYGYEEATPDSAAGCDEENRSMDDHPILAAGAIAIPKQRRHQQKHHVRRRSSIDCPSKEYDILMPGEDIPLMKMAVTPSSSTNKKKKTKKHVHFHSDVLVKIILPAKDYLSGSGEGSPSSPQQQQEELWYSKQEFQSMRAEMRATLDRAEQQEQQNPTNGTTDEQDSTASSSSESPPPTRQRRKLFSFPKKSRHRRPRLDRTNKRKEFLEPQPQPKRQVATQQEDEDDEGHDNDEDNQFCLRGLEHHLKHRRNVYRTSKLRAWSAVFWEQRLQQEQQEQHQESPFVLEQPSHHDAIMWPTSSSSSTENPATLLEAPEERTAHRYHVATQAAMEEAVARGAQDETAIQDYLLDVKQSLRRMSFHTPQ